VQTFFESRTAEVDEKANLELQQPDVRQNLLVVDGRKVFDGLQFDDHALIDQQVNAEGVLENDAVVYEPYRLLPLYLKSPSFERPCQNGLVDRLQQPRPSSVWILIAESMIAAVMSSSSCIPSLRPVLADVPHSPREPSCRKYRSSKRTRNRAECRQDSE
jgi:hypothetical protein